MYGGQSEIVFRDLFRIRVTTRIFSGTVEVPKNKYPSKYDILRVIFVASSNDHTTGRTGQTRRWFGKSKKTHQP